MKLLSLLKKNWIENLRDWKILILTLSFAPLFVFLMHFYFGESVQVYRVIVINQDRGVTADGAAVKTGEKLINILKEARYPEGGSIFLIEEMEEIENAKSLLKDKTADLAVVIP
ncbi:MAG: hypothetical protein KJ727_01070, partial [Acidobacteria bacterium]|nr:hypothetical protein [Acidobacteriota bacterium]